MNWSSFICLYERVRAIVKTCAEYMEDSESEVVDMLLLHILNEKDFIKWIENRRNHRRIVVKRTKEDHLDFIPFPVSSEKLLIKFI
ncbi:hypothetical protein ASG46_17500 [Bacillus sp. Leaf49]|nr:hypothetical protein ASG46_17500 [Bacillus sp. Leaf49]